MQNALNETCRELFKEGFESYLRETTDDDKMHLQTGKDQDTQGLKVTQHVRDNRKGFGTYLLLHCIRLPIGIEWEHANDVSIAAATDRLIRAQLSLMSGQNNSPTLTSTEFAIDRGYCLSSLLFEFLIYDPPSKSPSSHAID